MEGCPRPVQKHTAPTDSLRGSSIEIGTMQRRLARPLRKDDTHKSRSVKQIAADKLTHTHTHTRTHFCVGCGQRGSRSDGV